MSNPMDALKGKFIVQSEPTRWIVTCRKCTDTWGLKKPPKGEPVKPGNILALLNHYRSHEA